MMITMELIWLMAAIWAAALVWCVKRNLIGDGFMTKPMFPAPFRLKHAEWTDPD